MKKIILIILCFILFSFIIFQLFNKGYLVIGNAVGISNGKPYCISCMDLSVSTTLIKPGVGDYASFKDGDGITFHKVINKVDGYYIFSSASGITVDIVKEEDVINMRLFEIPFISKKTNDFMEACEYEKKYIPDYDCNRIYLIYKEKGLL